MFLRINGEQHYLWRAVDQHSFVLDILVQDRRDATAAKTLLQAVLSGLRYKPRRIITDGLRSYGVAHRDVLLKLSTGRVNTSRTRTARRGGASDRRSGSSPLLMHSVRP